MAGGASLSSRSPSATGIWYFPSSQRPRSISLHRSEQNGYVAGRAAPSSATGVLQMGQRMWTGRGGMPPRHFFLVDDLDDGDALADDDFAVDSLFAAAGFASAGVFALSPDAGFASPAESFFAPSDFASAPPP